jgi:uncharacterized membrane protein
MAHSVLLFIHIGSALVGLLSGWTAFLLRKGSRRHGLVGDVFVVSMLSMCASAVTLAVMKQQTGNIIGGLLTAYLVSTAWLTAKRREGETGRFEWAAMLVALAVGVTTWSLGLQVLRSAAGPKDGVPAPVYFVFGSIALLSAAGDARMLVRGGVFGGPRLARHLWRMSTALLMATLSALAGKRVEYIPAAIRKLHLFNISIVYLPIFAILILMIFWLFRVRLARRYKRKATTPRIKTVPANILA